MNVLDMTIIRLAAGLVLLIAANIALGSINAIIAGKWDRAKFRNGCIKSAVVAMALIAVYFAGYLNPNLMVVEVDGQTVNLHRNTRGGCGACCAACRREQGNPCRSQGGMTYEQ